MIQGDFYRAKEHNTASHLLPKCGECEYSIPEGFIHTGFFDHKTGRVKVNAVCPECKQLNEWTYKPDNSARLKEEKNERDFYREHHYHSWETICSNCKTEHEAKPKVCYKKRAAAICQYCSI